MQDGIPKLQIIKAQQLYLKKPITNTQSFIELYLAYWGRFSQNNFQNMHSSTTQLLRFFHLSYKFVQELI